MNDQEMREEAMRKAMAKTDEAIYGVEAIALIVGAISIGVLIGLWL